MAAETKKSFLGTSVTEPMVAVQDCVTLLKLLHDERMYHLHSLNEVLRQLAVRKRRQVEVSVAELYDVPKEILDQMEFGPKKQLLEVERLFKLHEENREFTYGTVVGDIRKRIRDTNFEISKPI